MCCRCVCLLAAGSRARQLPNLIAARLLPLPLPPPQVTALDPKRSLDQGLPPPAVLRNPEQRPVTKAVLELRERAHC
jgi:hypothetical protein